MLYLLVLAGCRHAGLWGWIRAQSNDGVCEAVETISEKARKRLQGISYQIANAGKCWR